MNKRKCYIDRFLFKKHRSLNFCAVLLVFFIMIIAGVLTFISVSLFRYFGHLPNRFEAPLVIMIIALCVSVVIGTILSAMATRSILRPVNDMQKAMKRLRAAISPSGSQEIKPSGKSMSLLKASIVWLRSLTESRCSERIS